MVDDALAQDPRGCLRPLGHAGPHEYLTANGQRIQWEIDFNCECEHCQAEQGDYCTTYWEVTWGPRDK